MPTSVALGHHFESFVRDQVRNGRFNNSSEVVRAGLRLLQDQAQREQLELDALRAQIAAGQASGAAKPAQTVLKRLEQKYRSASPGPTKTAAKRAAR